MQGEQSSRTILDAISDIASSTKIQLVQLIRDRGYTPALTLGFENIDTDGIGLKKDFPYKDSGRLSME